MNSNSKLRRRSAFGRGLLACTAAYVVSASPALADCVADSAGTTVTCTGTSASYTNTATGVTLSSASGGTVTGPLTLGNTATISNAGTINAPSGGYAISAGSQSSVTNTGTIASAYSTTGSGAISLGDHSSVTNSGTLTAVAGTPVATLGRGSSFTNTAAATAAVTGVVQFAVGAGADINTFTNQNTTYGFTGTVASSGNTAFVNSGTFTGAFTQTAALGSVQFDNQSGGTFSGLINTGDVTTAVNSGTMTLSSASVLGSLGIAGTSLTNNASLTVGSSTTPTLVSVYGNFTQSNTGTLVMPIRASGTGSPIAGTTYSQIHAIGANGTATLDGKLTIAPAAGFYANGSLYNVIVADQGITGNFATVTDNSLAFITFQPVGIVTLSGGGQAYQLMAVRTNTYAGVLSSVGTANQLAIATGLEPLVTYASANPTSTAATLVGQIDVLSIADAQTFLDSVSPVGYRAYAASLRDQSDLFQRSIALRMFDFNADRKQHGWWAQALHQTHFGSVSAGQTKQAITGAVGGYDWTGPNYIFGGSLSYSSDSLKNDTGSLTGHTTSGLAGAYAGYKFGPLVAQGQVSYLFGTMKTTKTITLGTATRTATASSPVHMLTATGTLGLDLSMSGLAFRPFGGISYHQGAIKGFTETGANAADLTVSRISASRTDLIAGATVTRDHGKWRPYVKATYRTDLDSSRDNSVTAYFNDDTSTLFTVHDLGASKNQVDVDAGVNIVFEDEGNIFLGYQGTFRNDMKAHGVMAGLRVQF